MCAYDSQDWPIEDPPQDFVDRTTAAVLRAQTAAQRRSRTRRWILAGALAAALVNAAAFAMVAHERRHAQQFVQPLSTAAVQTASARVVQPHTEPATTTSASTPEPMAPVAKPPPSASHHRPVASASASVSAAPAVASGFKPPAPRCDCVEGVSMCTCLQ